MPAERELLYHHKSWIIYLVSLPRQSRHSPHKNTQQKKDVVDGKSTHSGMSHVTSRHVYYLLPAKVYIISEPLPTYLGVFTLQEWIVWKF